MDKTKVSLIGLGVMGSNHLRLLASNPSVEIQFLFDSDSEKLRAACFQVGIPVVSLNKVIESSENLIIASPTSTHVEYYRMASQFAKNIFIEKA